MYSNISPAIDQFLAEVLRRDVVEDLEPLRVQVLLVEPRGTDTRPVTVESVDLALAEFDEHEVRGSGF